MDPFSNSRIYTLRPNPTFHEPWMSKEQKAENARISSGHIRRSADMWWKTLIHETRVKYASEQLAKRGQIFKYNNDGLISGFTLSDVVELFRHYA